MRPGPRGALGSAPAAASEGLVREATRHGEELAAHPQLCVVLFEPIDNATLTRASDHIHRLHWLELLFKEEEAQEPCGHKPRGHVNYSCHH